MKGAGFREQGSGFRAEQEPFSPHGGREGEALVAVLIEGTITLLVADVRPLNGWGYI